MWPYGVTWLKYCCHSLPYHLLTQSLGVKKKQILEAHNPRQNVTPPLPQRKTPLGRKKPPAKNETQYANNLSQVCNFQEYHFQGQTTEEYITQNMPLFSHHPRFGVFVWLVIFVRDLFSLFSRVKSHSRKLKPQNFHCPHVKRVNRISIQPTSNCLAILTPTEACLQVCLWRLSLKPSNISIVSYFNPLGMKLT